MIAVVPVCPPTEQSVWWASLRPGVILMNAPTRTMTVTEIDAALVECVKRRGIAKRDCNREAFTVYTDQMHRLLKWRKLTTDAQTD